MSEAMPPLAIMIAVWGGGKCFKNLASAIAAAAFSLTSPVRRCSISCSKGPWTPSAKACFCSCHICLLRLFIISKSAEVSVRGRADILDAFRKRRTLPLCSSTT